MVMAYAQGSGRQQKGAVINLVAFYVFAMPLALFLGFYAGWGVLGLFAGMGLGPIIQTLLYGWLVLRTGAQLAYHVKYVPRSCTQRFLCQLSCHYCYIHELLPS